MYNSFDPTGTKQTRAAMKLCQYDIAVQLYVSYNTTYNITSCIIDYIIIIVYATAMLNTNGVKLCYDVSKTKYILSLYNIM